MHQVVMCPDLDDPGPGWHVIRDARPSLRDPVIVDILDRGQRYGRGGAA